MQTTSIITHDKNPGLFISLPHLLDSMTEDDRKQLVAFACEDAVFLESVCRAVATSDAEIPATGAVDCWFGESTKTRLRLALLPLLDAAVAAELKAAVEKAERYEKAHEHLSSLAFFDQLKREADDYDRPRRHDQWVVEYRNAMRLFPQYAAK